MRVFLWGGFAVFLTACDPGFAPQTHICGNGIQEPTEACDDGDNDSGDGCDALCIIERCGDGIVNNNNEACDDGNNTNTDSCRNSCKLPACGDGIVDAGELCDDNNTTSGDGCSLDCQPEVCGDGIVAADEECDDANQINDDDCTNVCTSARCGDGIVQSGEQCDDANTNGGCSPTCTSEPFAGNCNAPFPGSVLEDFQHSFASNATILAGDPNHHIRDIVVNPGEAGTMLARFTYGTIDKDLEDERVEVWIQTCPNWESLGVFVTDSDGFIQIPVSANIPKGDYSLKAVVLGDGTIADGFLGVWPSNVQVVISDIDGTLTTSDFQLIEELLLGTDAEMFADANNVIQSWAGKDYRMVFLTGRPQILNRYSRDWLKDHGFPRGVVKLTNDNTDVIPSESGVQQFKADFLNDLIARVGVHFVRAYGNATTDIGAYNDAGIPKIDTFIIGDHAGEENTQVITSYTDHLPSLSAIPSAVQP